MIFVTVGSQTPFDRLILAADEWARLHPEYEVRAQIANTSCHPQFMKFSHFMSPQEFAQTIREAQVIVAHAGMGTIISALELGKQVVVMPRRAALHETRNDHQVATAKRFGAQGRIIVASDERDLPARLDHAVTLGESARIDAQASPRLLATLRGFLTDASEDSSPVSSTSVPNRDSSSRLSPATANGATWPVERKPQRRA